MIGIPCEIMWDPFLYNRKFHGIPITQKKQISKISALQKHFSMLIW